MSTKDIDYNKEEAERHADVEIVTWTKGGRKTYKDPSVIDDYFLGGIIENFKFKNKANMIEEVQ